MRTTRAGAAAAVLLSAGAALVGSASGQSAPTPVPGCAGIQLVDKKGDSGNPTMDVTAVWFDHVDGKTYANIQVANLKKAVPSGSTMYYWRLDYTAPDTSYRLQAFVESSGAESFYFKRLTGGQAYVEVGTLPGQIFTGADGVVRWDITGAGGVKDANLTGAFALTDEVIAGHPRFTGYLRVVPSADDTTGTTAKAYKVAPCEGGPPAGDPTPTPTPDPTAAPAPPAPPTPPAGPPPAGPAPAPADGGVGPRPTDDGSRPPVLDLAVSKRVPRAKRVKRKLALAISSRRGVSDVDAVLVRQGKKRVVVGRGHVRKLKGKGKLKLRVTRKFRKGAHMLHLAGSNAGGEGATRSVKLRFR